MNRHKVALVLATILWVACLILQGWVATRADAAPSHKAQPYGGCKEAWQAPHSRGADDCRARGWTVWPNVVFTPRGRIVYCNRAWCR